MASSFFKRLEKTYGNDLISGSHYRMLIAQILGHNNEKMANAVHRLTDSHYQESLNKLNRKRPVAVTLPNIERVIPKRSVFIIKGADSGDFLLDKVRDRLQRDLRNTLDEYKGHIEIKRGTTTGKMNPDITKRFQEVIRKSFESSVKRDEITGMPSNIRNIAVTETRSTVNNVKKMYHAELLRKNPALQMTKTWYHNKRLSMTPRVSHMNLNGTTVPFSQKFKVERDRQQGVFDMMDHPHDPNAPADQVIGCSCDFVVRIQLPAEGKYVE